MTLRVPNVPSLPSLTSIQGGRIVGGREWVQLAQLVNHLEGCGATIVPAHDPAVSIAAGSNRDFRYRTALQLPTVALCWVLRLRSGDSVRDTDATLTAPSATGVATVKYASPDRLSQPIVYIEPRAAQSASELEINIKIAAGAYAVLVESIACYALPRGSLVRNSTDHGIDDTTVSIRQPIFDAGAGAGRSLAETMRNITGCLTTARRVGIAQLGVPDNDGDAFQVTTASPSWQTLYSGAVPMLARKLYTSSTTGTISCKVLVKCSGALVAGSLRVNTTSGGAAAATITIPAGTTSYTWLPANAATFTVDCEDLTADDGRRSTRWDDVTFEANYSVAGTIYVATISCWEA